MKKKMISFLVAIFLCLFSFYYTSKSVDLVKNIDPIMNQINENLEKYEVPPINAKIEDDNIIPGIQGKVVDKDLSYAKMKKYGQYNESLTTIKRVKPKISIENIYDKYIVSGNENKRQVSLIFNITSIDDLELITHYLNIEHVMATLLIDTKILNECEEELSKLANFQIELSFDEITDINVSSMSNYLDSITGYKNKYCISKEKEEKLLSVCQKYKMHTVIPNIQLGNSPSLEIKKELKNGSIIFIDLNSFIKKELDYVLFYIKSKGYSFSSLEQLLRE